MSDLDKLRASSDAPTVGEILTERGIGDNGPPETTPLETHTINITDLYSEAANFLDGAKIKTQEEADDVTRIKDAASKASKAADAQRKVEAKPFDDGKKKVQADWTPIIAKADKVETAAKATLTDWLNREAAKAKAEAEVRRQEAQALADKALAESRAAASYGDINALEAAEDALKEAKDANREATRAENFRPAAKVEGMARAMKLRTVWECELATSVEGETSAPTLLARWAFQRDRQRCIDFFMALARDYIRAGVRSIPGVNITSRETL